MKENNVYKGNLTFAQKVNYEILLRGIKECRKSIRIMETNIDTLNLIIEAIRKDNTSLYYVGTFRYSISNMYSIITPQYLYQKDGINRFNNDIHSICEQLNKLVTGNTEWGKVLYIHDWLCEQIRYFDTGQESHTIIGALINHTAVCEGIAKTAKLLFDFIGIECCVISGKAKSSFDTQHYGNHSWNKVKINDKWFNIDVTFDLTLSCNGIIRHDYFCVSDAEISKSHFEAEKIFDASETGRDYYSTYNLVFPTQQIFLEYVKTKLNNREYVFEIKIPKTNDLNIVESKILSNTLSAIRCLQLSKMVELNFNKEMLVAGIRID